MRLELTRRGDYAIRAMLALARAGDDTWLSVSRIARAMSIPARFLPQVMADLTRGGLVRAATGRTGGYQLARRPDAVSLLEVIEAVEGESRRRTCVLRGGPCGSDGHCAVHETFFRAQEALLAVFATTTLEALAREVDATGLPTP